MTTNSSKGAVGSEVFALPCQRNAVDVSSELALNSTGGSLRAVLFAEKRKRGEWFNLSTTDTQEAIAIMEEDWA